jgi:hypothetical protein
VNPTEIMNSKLLPLAILFAATLAGCGGDGASTPPASPPPPPPLVAPTHLSYADPASSGWRLVKNAASTDTRIVLDLVGPAGTPTRGVGFNLKKGLGLAFSPFASGAYALDTGVFQLRGTNTNWESFAGSAADPVLFVSAPLKSGNVLSTGIFQKDRSNAPKDSVAPLVQVAVALADFAKLDVATVNASGDPYGLHVVKARIVPADIGGMDFSLSPEVIAKAKMLDIVVDVGTLTATP